MLAGFIQLIHILVCVGLIVIVLLQADKGEGLAGAFGGGASSTVFGERGAGGFMSKLTTSMAIIFMITSLVIAIFVPRWEEAAPAAQYSAPAAGYPVSIPTGLPIQVPDTSAAPVVVAPEAVAVPAPVTPVAVTAEPVAAPAVVVTEPVAPVQVAPAAAVVEPITSAPVAPAPSAEIVAPVVTPIVPAAETSTPAPTQAPAPGVN